MPDGIAVCIHDFGVVHHAGHAIGVRNIFGGVEVVHRAVQRGIAVSLPAGKGCAGGGAAAHIPHGIKVNLGDDTDLEDKMSALNSIYAQLDGRHGTLYMESYSENSGQVTFKNESGGTEDLASTDGSSESETSTQETQEGGGRMYSKTDGTFSTDANGNKTYTDAAGVTTTQCDEYNYTDENGNIITDGYGYIDPYTGSYIN